MATDFYIGESLVAAIEMALEEGEPAAAQLVAAESVVLAETKDHLNWHLLGEVMKKAKGDVAKVEVAPLNRLSKLLGEIDVATFQKDVLVRMSNLLSHC